MKTHVKTLTFAAVSCLSFVTAPTLAADASPPTAETTPAARELAPAPSAAPANPVAPVAPAPVAPVAPAAPPVDPGASAPPTSATPNPSATPSATVAPTPSASQAGPRQRWAAPEDDVVRDDGQMGSHQLHFYGSLGYRAAFISDEGYDPFSSDDVLSWFSLTLGRVLVTQEDLSFALGAGWDYGHNESTVRSTKTVLDLHRLTLVPEARYHVARRLYGFGRVGAGVALLSADLERAGGVGDGELDDVAFTIDPSVGVAWEAIGEPSGDSQRPRVWLAGDVGYLFTSKMDLLFEPGSGVPSRAQATSLGELGLSGFNFRLLAAITY